MIKHIHRQTTVGPETESNKCEIQLITKADFKSMRKTRFNQRNAIEITE